MLRVKDQKSTINLHFVALLSAKENAIPLALPHGWPGSFVDCFPRYLSCFVESREESHKWPEEPSDGDDILTKVTPCWLINTLPRSIYTYRHTFLGGEALRLPYFNQPLGCSWFRQEDKN